MHSLRLDPAYHLSCVGIYPLGPPPPVLHHISTLSRRVQLVSENMRVLKVRTCVY
jgi:hypothetical protein